MSLRRPTLRMLAPVAAVLGIAVAAWSPVDRSPVVQAQARGRIFLPLMLRNGRPLPPIDLPTRTPGAAASPTGAGVEPTPTRPGSPATATVPGPSPTPGVLSRMEAGWRHVTDPNLVLDLAVDPVSGEAWSAARYAGAVRWNAGPGLTGRVGLADGLGSAAVERVAVSETGEVWLGGTDGRLSRRFGDGRWQVFGPAQGLGPGAIHGLAAAPGGRLWLSQEDRLMLLNADGSWQRQTLPPGVTALRGLAAGADGRVYVAAPGQLLERGTDGRWTMHALVGLGTDVAVAADGALAVATVAELYLRLPGRSWEVLSLSKGNLDALPLAVAFDAAGRLILGTDDGPRRREADGRWTRWAGAAAGAFCYAVAVDPDGRVLAGTADGLVVVDESGPRRLAIPALPGDTVRRIAFDAGAGAWLALPGRGLARLAPDGGWQREGAASGLGTDAVWDLAYQDDILWVATADLGLRRRDAGGAWTGFTRLDGLGADEVTTVHVDAIGQVWAGHLRGLPLPGEPVGGLSLRRLGGGWTVFTTANGLADNSVRALASDLAGNLWAASFDKGLSRRDPSGAWTIYDRAAGALPSDTVQALAVAPDGTVYAGTDAGLAIRSVDGLWRHLDQADGLPSDLVSSLYLEADGRLWIGTEEGAAVLRPDGSLSSYLPRDGALLPGAITAMAVDAGGAPWLASQGAGIAVLEAARRTDR